MWDLRGMFGSGKSNLLMRLFYTVLMFWVVSFASFSLLYYSKGSVAFALSPQAISPALRAQIENNLSLDQPLLVQYKTWVFRALQGDFSHSLVSGEPVLSILKERLPYTLILGGVAFALLFFLSIALGILCLFHPILDRLVTFLGISLASLPTFSLGLLLILFLSAQWGLFPSSGVSEIGMEQDFLNRLWHLILPVSALVLSHLGFFVQFVRTTLFEALNQGFIYFGLARGISPYFIYRFWVLKYALSPIIAYFSSSFVSFMVGAYVIEGVFGYGGIGGTLIDSLIFKDYPVVLAILMLSFLCVMVVNLIADISCAVLNQGRV